jgi:CheY-like chemotaxis protein
LEAVARPGPLACRRILVVDDQAQVRNVLMRALCLAGASVREAPDGHSALQAIEAEIPELILLDLAMPLMDGWGVIAALQASARTASIPVILETSSDDLANLRRAQHLGVAGFISKPFRLGDVVESCRRVLDSQPPPQKAPWVRPGPSAVVLSSVEGEPVARGVILGEEEEGVRVDLERRLTPKRVLRFSLDGLPGTRLARVRWVKVAGERFHHGLSFLPPPDPDPTPDDF